MKMIYRNAIIVSAVCFDNSIQFFKIQYIFYFDSHTIGDTLSRVTNDVDTVGQTMNQCFATMIFYIAVLIGATLLTLYTNWIMTLCGIGLQDTWMFEETVRENVHIYNKS